jgi:biopolymer transport protein ExbD
MAGFNNQSDDELVSAINVTPLVDVVLVLLVIFLITAPIIYQSAIKVRLPSAKTAEKTEKSLLNFTITKDGQVTWNRDRIDWDTLGKRLATLGPQDADATAMISADEAAAHGLVIRLMDTLRQAGINRFAMSVDSRPAGK